MCSGRRRSQKRSGFAHESWIRQVRPEEVRCWRRRSVGGCQQRIGSTGVHLDPVLQGIDVFLGQHSDLVEQVRRDLERGLKNPTTGRSGITPSQTLRSLTLMRVKNWDYRELRERINDGYTLRGFTQFDSHLVPKHDAFNRAFNRLTPATLQAINPSNSVWKTARNSASTPR